MEKGDRPIRALLIEDNPADARLIRELLVGAKGVSFDLKWAKRLSEGLDHLAGANMDVVLVDLGLPETTGLDTFIKVHQKSQTIPVVVLTGLADEETAIKTVQMGAQDYIVKGQVESRFLVRSIRYAIERKEVEARLRRTLELEQLTEILENRVKQRTAELERRNKELQEFAFVAAHDLSEPLRKIQTFGSLLEAKSADRLGGQERDYVSRMTGAAKRMQELLDALLKYSRVDTKGQEFRPSKLDDIVRDAVTDLEVVIRKVEARVKIDKLPIAMGDPNHLRQLFQNLLANSLKYHRQEVKPLIRVYGDENNGACRIVVEDNGIGFDEKYLDKIFQPFQRLHGRNEYSGTGIGLAICKKIVERHGGTITATSTPGKGSTFMVTLPVNRSKETN